MKMKKAALTALAAVLTIYFLLVSPLENAKERIRAELPLKLAAIEKHRRFVKRYSAEKGRIEHYREQLEDLERYTIRESDPSIAAASVQSRVQDIAGSAGISIKSIRALAPVKTEGYSTLPVFIDGRGTIANISRLMNQLDNSWELLALEKLEISSTRRGGELRFKVQIAGLMRNE